MAGVLSRELNYQKGTLACWLQGSSSFEIHYSVIPVLALGCSSNPWTTKVLHSSGPDT